MNKLIYPNLFLFLYDWRDGLGEEQKELANNQITFAAKFPESCRQSLFDRDTPFESEYLELLAQQIEEFPQSDQPFEGYYYPVRLNDIYGLMLGCSFAEDTTRHPTSCLADFKAKIEEKLNYQSPTIGQSWLILAHLDNSNNNPENIAQECCQSLNLGLNWEQDLQGKGRFLGGTIFELWRYELQMPNLQPGNKIAPTLQQIQQNNHLIISIYPNADTAKEAAEFYRSWMRLFSYRHKILWAYAQSRYLKQQLKKDFTIVNKLAEFSNSKNLKQLRQTVVNAQNILPNYTTNLNYLEAQIRTIEINRINYSRRIKTISDRLNQIQTQNGQNQIDRIIPILSWFQSLTATSNPTSTNPTPLLSQIANWQNPCDLKFLEKFSEKVENQYQLQLQKDYDNLSPGLQLLRDLIESSRTITEIDKAGRDRNFQNTLAIVGVGLGVGSLVVSLEKLGEATDDPVRLFLSKSISIPKFWLDPAIPLIYGVGLGVIAAGFTALMLLAISLWKRSR